MVLGQEDGAGLEDIRPGRSCFNRVEEVRQHLGAFGETPLAGDAKVRQQMRFSVCWVSPLCARKSHAVSAASTTPSAASAPSAAATEANISS